MKYKRFSNLAEATSGFFTTEFRTVLTPDFPHDKDYAPILTNKVTGTSIASSEKCILYCEACTDGPTKGYITVRDHLEKMAEKYNTIVLIDFDKTKAERALARGFDAYCVFLSGRAYFFNMLADVDRLTHRQKLEALAARFYNNLQWHPKAGDYYTTSRADLELYRIVREDDENFYTSYLPEGGTVSAWPKSEFTEQGFGPKRVWVPPYIFDLT